jgi:hypothetical protein
MERSIPIFEALIAVDPHKHYYFGQLGFAYKDSIRPDWKAAKNQFDQAITLLGENDDQSWPFYQFNRAICLIKLDANYAEGKASDPATRKAILKDLAVAKQGIYDFEEILEQPYNFDIRRWRQINNITRNE